MCTFFEFQGSSDRINIREYVRIRAHTKKTTVTFFSRAANLILNDVSTQKKRAGRHDKNSFFLPQGFISLQTVRTSSDQ